MKTFFSFLRDCVNELRIAIGWLILPKGYGVWKAESVLGVLNDCRKTLGECDTSGHLANRYKVTYRIARRMSLACSRLLDRAA